MHISSIKQKLNCFVLVITSLCIVIIGAVSLANYRSMTVNLLGNQALSMAKSISPIINGDEIENYSLTGKKDANWNILYTNLSKIKTNSGMDFLYVLTDNGDGKNFKSIVEGHVAGRTDDQTTLGTLDPKSTFVPQTQDILNDGKPFFTQIYDSDDYGKLISGYVPIKNGEGKTVALLGVDISANEAMAQVYGYIPKLAGLLILCELLLFVLLRSFIDRLVVNPVKKLLVQANSISNGDLDFETDVKSNDELGMLASAFGKIAVSLRRLIKDADDLCSAAQAGDLKVRANEADHQGDYRRIISGVNKTLDAVVTPLGSAAACIESISRGDIPAPVTEEYRGDFNLLKDNLNTLIGSINALIEDADLLSQAGIAGNLTARANEKRHNGDFRKIISGVNRTLDAVIEPIDKTAACIESISLGVIPENIDEDYAGDFNRLKENLNTCFGSIRALVEDADMLSRSALEGRLSARADETRHSGDFRRIISGVNRTLDAVITPLRTAAGCIEKLSLGQIPKPISEKFSGDFAVLINNLNICIASINALVEDAETLNAAALEGKLSVRADENRHSGDYRKIIGGFNATLDALIRPLEETASCLDQFSRGDLSVQITGDYKGDLLAVKDSLNFTIKTISGYLGEISEVLGEISKANLNVEITDEYAGDFNVIKVSINDIISSLNLMLTEMLGGIKNAGDRIAASSGELVTASRNISAGATEQAGALEELSSSMAEISDKTRKNAEAAERTSRFMADVNGSAKAGEAQMAGMLEAINAINGSARNISKINVTIADIAFQTNILALNAAVEAARAGSYGKGFAVVAEEVRNLASRSADSAKETSQFIEGTLEKVANGKALAEQSVKSFSSIAEGISKVVDHVGEISRESNAQSKSFSQIEEGLGQVSKVVQTNSATAEQSAASAELLSDQARLLKEQLGKFSLK